MGRITWLTAVTAAAWLALPTSIWSQQNDPQTPSQGPTQSESQAAPASGQDSLADAARKAREEKKEAPKSSKTFTNDNLPSAGGISTVGDKLGSPSNDATAEAGQTPNDEKAWRAKFAVLRHKLEQDQANLDVMQRELGQLNLQYYSDPMKTLQQGLTRSDINDKTAEIDKMKSQIEADQQAISDAEEELRKSGGDPGWAR
jgi:chromosome segregation ATPase